LRRILVVMDVMMPRMDALAAVLGQATVAAMVAAFVEAVSAQLAEMRDLAAAGDTDAVMRASHALAPAAQGRAA
jgi:HPt (histidine-containing phosphotransfer) domain-containing protein